MGSKKRRERATESSETKTETAIESTTVQRTSHGAAARSTETAAGSQAHAANSGRPDVVDVHGPNPDELYGGNPMAACDVGGTAPAPTPSEYNVQRALSGADTTQDDVPDTVLEVLGQGGKPLETPIQRALEERLDADFSNVRIHTGTKAAEAADAIDAKAFTCGNDIVFNAGEYDPDSAEGQFLLAHELAHVRQQTGAAISMMPQSDADLEIDPDPQLEREADETAKEALSEEGPLIVNQMGTDVHIQRTALGKLNPFSGKTDRDGGELVLDEVEADPEALAEEVRNIKINQTKLFNAVNSERSTIDRVGEAAGAGVVGGTAGLVIGAVTSNPVLGSLAGGAVSDVGKTLYGKLWGKGRDAIANAEIPDVSLDQLGGVKASIEELIDEKLRQRFDGTDYDSEDPFNRGS